MIEEILNLAKRIKTISDTGLLYNQNEYDIERYSELKEIGLDLMGLVTGEEPSRLATFYSPVTDYPTPKVDVRGLLLNEDKQILLVREKADGLWTLPGGWADVGLSPSEVIVKEFKEETGLQVTADKLLAVFDKRCHLHPPQPYYVYKVVFFCKLAGNLILNKGFDILDVGFFDINELPPLSVDRIVKDQIDAVYDVALNNKIETAFD